MPLLRLPRAALTATRAFSTTRPAHVARMTIVGRLAAEPEVTATSTGKDVIRYAVGTSHGPQDNRTTSWFRVASFDEGPRRDLLLSLPKGTLVYVEADSRMRTYEDAEGKKRVNLDLVQNRLDILSRPRSASADAAGDASPMAATG